MDGSASLQAPGHPSPVWIIKATSVNFSSSTPQFCSALHSVLVEGHRGKLHKVTSWICLPTLELPHVFLQPGGHRGWGGHKICDRLLSSSVTTQAGLTGGLITPTLPLACYVTLENCLNLSGHPPFPSATAAFPLAGSTPLPTSSKGYRPMSIPMTYLPPNPAFVRLNTPLATTAGHGPPQSSPSPHIWK